MINHGADRGPLSSAARDGFGRTEGRYILVSVRQGSFEPCSVPSELRTKLRPWSEPVD